MSILCASLIYFDASPQVLEGTTSWRSANPACYVRRRPHSIPALSHKNVKTQGRLHRGYRSDFGNDSIIMPPVESPFQQYISLQITVVYCISAYTTALSHTPTHTRPIFMSPCFATLHLRISRAASPIPNYRVCGEKTCTYDHSNFMRLPMPEQHD